MEFKVGDRVRHRNLVDDKDYEGTVWRVDDDPKHPVVVELDGVGFRCRYQCDELEPVQEDEQ